MKRKNKFLQKLYDIASELDEAVFYEKLQNFLNIPEPDFQSYISYITETYVKNAEFWAYCYRIGAGANTNMPLEAFHKILKYIHGKAKKVKSVYSALKIIEDALSYRLNVIFGKTCKPRITYKLQLLRRAHDRTVEYLRQNMNTASPYVHEISKNKWEVSSFPFLKSKNSNDEDKSRREEIIESNEGRKKYQVQKIRDECTHVDCNLKCIECKSCAHMYICSCVENAIKTNMCKHIHLLCLTCVDNELDPDASRCDVPILNNDEELQPPDGKTYRSNDNSNIDINHVQDEDEQIDICKKRLRVTFDRLLEGAGTLNKLGVIEGYLKNASVAVLIDDSPSLKILPGASSPLSKQKRF